MATSPTSRANFASTESTGKTGPRPEALAHPPIAINTKALLFALVGAMFIVGISLGVVLYLVRNEFRARAVPEDPAKVETGSTDLSETTGREEREARQREELEKRRQDFVRLMIQGGTALGTHHFEEAVQAYTEALKLFPEDVEAAKGLSAARTGLETAGRERQDGAKRQTEFARLMNVGQEALTAKQYAAAVRAFENALQVIPGQESAVKALGDAQQALAADQNEKKKLTEYEARMTAGRAAMTAQRYTEAVREFAAALQLLPTDAAALQAKRAAEKRLEDLQGQEKRQADYARLLNQATTSLRSQRFEEAVQAFEEVLKLAPGDRDATQGLKQAQQGLANARIEFARLMTLGDTATRAQRYEEAARYYGEAVRLFPGNELAVKSLRTVEKLMVEVISGTSAYLRFMNQAALAMRNQRYPEAIRNYSEALRLAPGDLDAAQGLRDARAALDAEVRNRPLYNKAMQAAAVALQQRQFTDAIKYYLDALRLFPDDPQALVGLHQARYAKHMTDGQAAFTAKKYVEAVREFQGALREMPGDPTASNALRQAAALVKK